jgi:hypothetical protein
LLPFYYFRFYFYFSIQLYFLSVATLDLGACGVKAQAQPANGGHSYLGLCAAIDGVHGPSPSMRGGDFGWSLLCRPLYISGHRELSKKKFSGNFPHGLYAKLKVGAVGSVGGG